MTNEFHCAILSRNFRIIEDLLRDDPELVHSRTPDGFSPLHLAVMTGRVEVVTALLAAGADPSAPGPNGETPLDTAIASFRAGIVEALDSAGAMISRPFLSRDQAARMKRSARRMKALRWVFAAVVWIPWFTILVSGVLRGHKEWYDEFIVFWIAGLIGINSLDRKRNGIMWRAEVCDKWYSSNDMCMIEHRKPDI